MGEAAKQSGSVVDSGILRRNTLIATIACWLSAVALLLGVAMSFITVGLLFPIAVAAVIIAIIALGMGLWGRRTSRGSRAVASLITSAIALLLALSLVGVFVVAMFTRPNLSDVEIRWDGSPGMTVEYSDDMREYTEEWPDAGFKTFRTERSSVELTVTAPEDADTSAVSCTILWNGTVVVQKASTGSVTCRYDR